MKRLPFYLCRCALFASILVPNVTLGQTAGGPGVPMSDPDPVPDPSFTDVDWIRVPAQVELGYLDPNGEEIVFHPSSLLVPFQLTAAEVPVPGETLLEREGRTYLEYKIGILLVRVVNSRSPEFGTADPPADVTLDVGREPVENVQLNVVYGLADPPTAEAPIAIKSLQAVPQGGAAAPFDEEPLDLADPSIFTCKGQAMYRFSQFAYQQKIPYDMPPVKFPPMSSCSEEECIDIYLAWIRAHHHIWRARQMMEVLAALPHHEQRVYAWGRPGRNFQGQLVTDRTAPSHWFGGFNSGRFNDIRTVINKLWDRFTQNKVGLLNLDLRCPTSGLNVCATTEGVIAHHLVAGRVDVCDLFFTMGGRCYVGTWDEDTETCVGGFLVSESWRQAEVMAHEVLHHTSVSGLIVQDKHTHGHGNSCAGSIKILESMYEYDNVRHLASYKAPDDGTCLHRNRARHNNDTYGYFITTIGDMVYRGQMKTWPAWGDPTPQPPQNCDVGDEGCYCRDTLPFGEGSEPDGDHADDLWCEDNDGEMTCQSTKFNASSTEGICTKCDVFRGAGCECDDQRLCDTGFCWGETTFGNGVGRCYKFPPPSWACLADCKKLYNDDQAWCYFDHPAGVGRCMDSLCSGPIEDVCNSQGKVCRYGECFDECVLTSDCIHNPQSQSNLGYPEYFVCSHQGFSRCEPLVANAQQAAQAAPGFAAENFGLGISLNTRLPGDANGDGVVDGDDFLIWQQNFGENISVSVADGDFDGSYGVTGGDFLIWQRNLGRSLPPVPTAAAHTAASAQVGSSEDALHLDEPTLGGSIDESVTPDTADHTAGIDDHDQHTHTGSGCHAAGAPVLPWMLWIATPFVLVWRSRRRKARVAVMQ